MRRRAFSDLSASERASALLDPGSLSAIGDEGDGASTVVTARGRLAGRPTIVAVTEGRRRGGTIGQAEARQLSHALAAAEEARAAVVVCWDTGGVRVQEGPAALAAASAVGVAIARLGLLGIPVAGVVSGPRGCFGAPSVIAAAGHRLALIADSLWGLTGPQLLDHPGAPATEAEARDAMAAARRVTAGHADVMLPDSPEAVRTLLAAWLGQRPQRRPAARALEYSAALSEALLAQAGPTAGASPDGRPARRRDLFAYSFRGHWQAGGPTFRAGHVHAAWGTLAGREVMAVLVGPERSHLGIGVVEARGIVRALQLAAERSRRRPVPIVTFVFCRGHASDLEAERAGLPRALAECLRTMVAARLLGHPLVCVLGGGAYGAAYLTLAAPCHRVLAIRGTTVAPMAPRVLATFRRLREVRHDDHTPDDLARHIPEIRIVESVVRLPRTLVEELGAAVDTARAEGRKSQLSVPA